MLDKLRDIKARYEQLTNLISQPEIIADNKQYRQLTKEHTDLGQLAHSYDEYVALQQELQSSQELASDPDEDPEIREMAQDEVSSLSAKLEDLEQSVKVLLLPKDPDDSRNTILEVRAGTGGEEAALFARDLFRMYTKYAELNRWHVSILDQSETDIGGFKEVILSIEGKDVFSRLKFEGGVHRVQRIPKTETQGRVHTSAATVAVMPEVEDVDVEIDANDIRVDVFRSSGPGGQSVNTTDSAVRITHIPTGMVVTCQNEKSQLKNKSQALKVLRARLYEHELATQQAETAQQRRSMVGSGDRSERIRTYNFPQGRVTDHRINLTLYQLESILLGNIDPLIDGLLTHHQAELLRTGEA